jgi:Rrf2 family protein
MKLTAQEEYGLRCILSLARIDEAGPREADGGSALEKPSLTVGRIAELEGISAEYAGKLMGILSKAGLVESLRGRNGGFRLARPAGEITVTEAMSALGGKLYEQTETCDRFSGDHALCIHLNACSIRSLWSGVQLMIDYVLDRTTLRDMIRAGEGAMAQWMRQHAEALGSFEVPDSDERRIPPVGSATPAESTGEAEQTSSPQPARSR